MTTTTSERSPAQPVTKSKGCVFSPPAAGRSCTMFGCSSSGQQAESLNFWVFRALKKGEGRLQVDSEVLYSVMCRHVRTVTCMFFLGWEPKTYKNSDDVRPHLCRMTPSQQQCCPACGSEDQLNNLPHHFLVSELRVALPKSHVM